MRFLSSLPVKVFSVASEISKRYQDSRMRKMLLNVQCPPIANCSQHRQTRTEHYDLLSVLCGQLLRATVAEYSNYRSNTGVHSNSKYISVFV